MTTAQLNARTSATVKTRPAQQKNGFSASRKPLLLRVLHRVWWHTKAYGTVLGIAPLVLGSLVFLFFHSFYNKLVQLPEKEG